MAATSFQFPPAPTDASQTEQLCDDCLANEILSVNIELPDFSEFKKTIYESVRDLAKELNKTKTKTLQGRETAYKQLNELRGVLSKASGTINQWKKKDREELTRLRREARAKAKEKMAAAKRARKVSVKREKLPPKKRTPKASVSE